MISQFYMASYFRFFDLYLERGGTIASLPPIRDESMAETAADPARALAR